MHRAPLAIRTSVGQRTALHLREGRGAALPSTRQVTISSWGTSRIWYQIGKGVLNDVVRIVSDSDLDTAATSPLPGIGAPSSRVCARRPGGTSTATAPATAPTPTTVASGGRRTAIGHKDVHLSINVTATPTSAATALPTLAAPASAATRAVPTPPTTAKAGPATTPTTEAAVAAAALAPIPARHGDGGRRIFHFIQATSIAAQPH